MSDETILVLLCIISPLTHLFYTILFFLYSFFAFTRLIIIVKMKKTVLMHKPQFSVQKHRREDRSLRSDKRDWVRVKSGNIFKVKKIIIRIGVNCIELVHMICQVRYQQYLHSVVVNNCVCFNPSLTVRLFLSLFIMLQCAHTHTHVLSLSHTLSLSSTLYPSHSLTLSHLHSLSLQFTTTLTLSLTHNYSLSHTSDVPNANMMRSLEDTLSPQNHASQGDFILTPAR